MVLIPEYFDSNSEDLLYDDRGFMEGYINNDFHKVMAKNNDDGQGPITYLSQEDSDNISNAHRAYTFSSIKEFLKMMGYDMDEEDE